MTALPDDVRVSRAPRRSRSRESLLTVTALVAATAWLGASVAQHPGGVADLWPGATPDPVAIAAPDQLPVTERWWPAPGFEEGTAPLGSPAPPAEPTASHAFSVTQEDEGGAERPVLWSPCRPVHYVVDPTGAPDDFRATVAAVVGELAAATGLHLVDDGVTTEPATTDREPFQPALYGDRWAPVLVRFADDDAVPNLTGDVAGIGGAQPVTDPTTGVQHLVSGYVYLDVDLLEAPPLLDEPAYVSVLRHELGHALGLSHVDDPTQLMFPQPFAATFQAGDLAGLAAAGRGACAPGL